MCPGKIASIPSSSINDESELSGAALALWDGKAQCNLSLGWGSMALICEKLFGCRRH